MEQLVLNLPANWKCEHTSRIQEDNGFGDIEIDDYTIIPDEDSFFSSIQISYIDQHIGADDVADIWASKLLENWDLRDNPKPELQNFVKKTQVADCVTYYYVDSYPIIDEARIYFFLDTSWKQAIIIAELKVWAGGENESKAIDFLSNAISFKSTIVSGG